MRRALLVVVLALFACPAHTTESPPASPAESSPAPSPAARSPETTGTAPPTAPTGQPAAAAAAPGPTAAPPSPANARGARVISDGPDPEQLELIGAEMPPNDDRRPALLFRVGAAWAERARRADAPAAAEMRRRAVERLSELARSYPNFARLDEALVELAWAEVALGEPAAAQAACARLLEDFPMSRLVPNALVVLGDIAFEDGRMADARPHYEAATRFGDTDLYPYACYKLGWIELSESRPTEALERFRETAAAAIRRGQESLARTARSDAVIAYASVGTPGHAYQLLGRLPGVSDDETLALLLLLAVSYVDLGRGGDAVATMDEILRRSPGPELCTRIRHWVTVHATALGDASAAQRLRTRVDGACPPRP